MSRSETNRSVLVTMLGVVALTTSVVVVSAQPNEPGAVAIERTASTACSQQTAPRPWSASSMRRPRMASD